MSRSLWAERLPMRWPLGRVKDHAQLINGYPFDSSRFNASTGTPVIRIRDLLQGRTETYFDGYVPPEVIVHDGDLVVGMDGDFNAVVWRGGDAALNQRLCMLRASESLDSRYLAYFIPVPLRAINDVTYFTTVKHLSSLDLLAERIPLPPLSTQRAIADYLDAETGRIDALTKVERLRLMAAQERLLSAVQSLVLGRTDKSERDNDPAGPLLPLPSHWTLRRNKTFMREITDLSGTGDEELLTVSHITGVTPRSEKDVNMFLAASNEGYKRVKPGDLVVNTMWAWMGALGVSQHTGIVSPAYGVYRFTETLVDPRYFDALFRSPAYVTEMTRHSKGVWTSRLRLYPESFLALRSPFPTFEIQRQIGEDVIELREETDRLASLLHRSLNLLLERRGTLITAAVMGQFEVPGVAA